MIGVALDDVAGELLADGSYPVEVLVLWFEESLEMFVRAARAKGWRVHAHSD